MSQGTRNYKQDARVRERAKENGLLFSEDEMSASGSNSESEGDSSTISSNPLPSNTSEGANPLNQEEELVDYETEEPSLQTEKSPQMATHSTIQSSSSSSGHVSSASIDQTAQMSVSLTNQSSSVSAEPTISASVNQVEQQANPLTNQSSPTDPIQDQPSEPKKRKKAHSSHKEKTERYKRMKEEHLRMQAELEALKKEKLDREKPNDDSSLQTAPAPVAAFDDIISLQQKAEEAQRMAQQLQSQVRKKQVDQFRETGLSFSKRADQHVKHKEEHNEHVMKVQQRVVIRTTQLRQERDLLKHDTRNLFSELTDFHKSALHLFNVTSDEEKETKESLRQILQSVSDELHQLQACLVDLNTQTLQDVSIIRTSDNQPPRQISRERPPDGSTPQPQRRDDMSHASRQYQRDGNRPWTQDNRAPQRETNRSFQQEDRSNQRDERYRRDQPRRDIQEFDYYNPTNDGLNSVKPKDKYQKPRQVNDPVEERDRRPIDRASSSFEKTQKQNYTNSRVEHHASTHDNKSQPMTSPHTIQDRASDCKVPDTSQDLQITIIEPAAPTRIESTDSARSDTNMIPRERKPRPAARKTEVFEMIHQTTSFLSTDEIYDRETEPQYDSPSDDSDVFPDSETRVFGTTNMVPFRTERWKYNPHTMARAWKKYKTNDEFNKHTTLFRTITDWKETNDGHDIVIFRRPSISSVCPNGFFCFKNKTRECGLYHTLRMDDVHGTEAFKSLSENDLAFPTIETHNLLRRLATEASQFFPMERERFTEKGNRLTEIGKFFDNINTSDEHKKKKAEKHERYRNFARERRAQSLRSVSPLREKDKAPRRTTGMAKHGFVPAEKSDTEYFKRIEREKAAEHNAKLLEDI